MELNELDLFILSQVHKCPLEIIKNNVNHYQEILAKLPDLEKQIKTAQKRYEDIKTPLDIAETSLKALNDEIINQTQIRDNLQIETTDNLFEFVATDNQLQALRKEKIQLEQQLRELRDKLTSIRHQIKGELEEAEAKKQGIANYINQEQEELKKEKALALKEYNRQKEDIHKDIRRVERMLHKNLILERKNALT